MENWYMAERLTLVNPSLIKFFSPEEDGAYNEVTDGFIGDKVLKAQNIIVYDSQGGILETFEKIKGEWK